MLWCSLFFRCCCRLCLPLLCLWHFVFFVHISVSWSINLQTQIQNVRSEFYLLLASVCVCEALFVKCLLPLLCQLFLRALSYALYCHFSTIESGNVFCLYMLPTRSLTRSSVIVHTYTHSLQTIRTNSFWPDANVLNESVEDRILL